MTWGDLPQSWMFRNMRSKSQYIKKGSSLFKVCHNSKLQLTRLNISFFINYEHGMTILVIWASGENRDKSLNEDEQNSRTDLTIPGTSQWVKSNKKRQTNSKKTSKSTKYKFHKVDKPVLWPPIRSHLFWCLSSLPWEKNIQISFCLPCLLYLKYFKNLVGNILIIYGNLSDQQSAWHWAGWSSPATLRWQFQKLHFQSQLCWLRWQFEKLHF